jgi:hypothetical protein
MKRFGVRRQSEATTALSHGMARLKVKSGVALRLPPQSKT